MLAGEIRKAATIVLEIESELVLFDVKMDIPVAYKEVEQGSQLRAQITLLNVGPAIKKVDVKATYIIKDKKGSIIDESSETFAVDKQLSYAKSFKIPKNAEPGEYLAVVEVTYENSFAVSSELFKVVPKTSIAKIVKSESGIVVSFFILLGFIVLFAYLLIPRKIFKKIGRNRERKNKKF